MGETEAMIRERKRNWNPDSEKRRCRCGRKMSIGSKSCRKCFESGKSPARKRGRSILSVLAEVRQMNLKPGQTATIGGLTFTKQ
jgi:hypothetical protein